MHILLLLQNYNPRPDTIPPPPSFPDKHACVYDFNFLFYSKEKPTSTIQQYACTYPHIATI